MAGEKFFLIFSENPNQRVRINEPINFSEVDFVLERRKNGMGLDVSLSGGSVSFRFTLYRHGKSFEDLLYYAHIYGFESNVKLIIQLFNGQEYSGDLDFAMAETNDFNYFECPVIMDAEMQVIKRRSETKVDLFSNLNTDNEFITPLQPTYMLLQAKPSVQISKWTNPSEGYSGAIAAAVNPAVNLELSGIEYSYTFFKRSIFFPTDERAIEDFKVIEAQTNLKNVTISFNGLRMQKFTSGGRNRLIYYKNSVPNILRNAPDNQTLLSESFSINIGDLARGESVSICWFTLGNCFVDVESIEITAESSTYNSIVPCFHVIDALKQISKSISGLEVNAPRYEPGGDLYGTVITNGKMLGGNITDPFYVSWDDIMQKSITPEVNADSEIQIDKRVFIGIEEDFYTNIECGFFNNTQFSGLNRKPNPLYCLNEFGLKYENYQSLKETTEPNSESTIHGETKFTPFNKRVENERALSIKWIRDAILLDAQQRLSTKVSKDTATQDDDKIFAIDTVPTENDQQFSESTSLQHSFGNNQLSLRSNGDVNFLVLGIRAGTSFTIQYPDKNAGVYEVVSVVNTELILVKTSGGSISASNDGIRLTKYTYEIKKETIPLTNRTNQGFNVVLNLISPDRYSNLRYSVQRNIRNYWNRFLATVNIYHKDKVLKNTFYKNNALCETEYAGLRIIEKEDWIPTDPIVTPYMYEDVVFANVDFEKVIMLWNNLRTQRGFIRTIDNNKRVLKLYPIKMSYEVKSRQLTLSGQEKFEKAYLEIVKANGIITINNETRLRKLTYDAIALERDNLVILFDLERERLYNGTFWNKVSINGAIPETKTILKEWLDLL
ncbi:hypothetical protein [uncultured Empedobacter sp.]|uniref:hypothetical protein n=1 Tax=uncultured Empedobacter sp. TaxID=410844 RepID=UPI0025CB9F69|nr:hypothetical protein [uncultured Empedobacter sp.]